VLVTGAASGIGRGIATMASERGANVLLFDLDQAGLEAARSVMTGPAACIAGDVREMANLQLAVTAAVELFGRLDGAVAAAGIGEYVSALDMSRDTWERMLAVNLTGVFLTLQAAARAMLAGGAGSLVAITSDKAFKGMDQGAHYAAAKAGVVALVKSFALEVSPRGIRVNSLSPGITSTSILDKASTAQSEIDEWVRSCPMGRVGTTEDMAKTACFLLSDDSAYMTGQCLHVNGGKLMR
jgi:NAD(P)-dependent dehydrogenase (short-subunit alcohol dehydrogenase family)